MRYGDVMPTVDVRQAESLRRLSELMRRVNSSTDLQGMLNEIATGVVEVLQFGVAAIAVRHGDWMVMTAIAGPDEVREQVLGRRTTVARLLEELNEYAVRWGILRFVPHQQMPIIDEELTWIPDIAISEDEDSWHPLDALYAPLYSATGELLGNMAVDLPPGNKIPSVDDRELLEMFVVQAGLALSHARQRDHLDKQVRLAALVREIGEGGRLADPERTLHEAAELVIPRLGLAHLWIRCFPDGDISRVDQSVCYPADGGRLDPSVLELKRLLAARALKEGLGVVVSRADLLEDVLDHAQRETAIRLMEDNGGDSFLVAPVAVGREQLGMVVLMRDIMEPGWDDEEREAAMEIGRTLGRGVLNSRLFARERQIVQELQNVDRYRSELIATISHELKTPLTSIMGHIELLEDLDTGIDSVPAISRNAQRLNRLVENLLAYSQTQDKREIVREAVDLAQLAANSMDLLAMAAEQGEVKLVCQPASEPVIVLGDPEELGKVIDNLTANAVKYTRPGGHVELSVTGDDTFAELQCSDNGLGISVTDQSQLFSAFNRSSNPAALSIPGTGLGLAISRRIARMHGGEILVESLLGHGSTFRLRLPLGVVETD